MIKHGGVDSCPSTPEKLILEQGNSNLPTCRKNVSPSIENTKKGPACLAFGRRAQHLSFKITLKTAIPKILQWNKDQKIPLGTLLFLCFGLCPVPRDFTKLLKVPMSILRCLMIQVIKSSHKVKSNFRVYHRGNTHGRKLFFFLLQDLSFMINFKKCILEAT